MNKKISSLSFVFMLIISTFAFAFLIGGEVKTVSGISSLDRTNGGWSEYHIYDNGDIGFYSITRRDMTVYSAAEWNSVSLLDQADLLEGLTRSRGAWASGLPAPSSGAATSVAKITGPAPASEIFTLKEAKTFNLDNGKTLTVTQLSHDVGTTNYYAGTGDNKILLPSGPEIQSALFTSGTNTVDPNILASKITQQEFDDGVIIDKIEYPGSPNSVQYRVSTNEGGSFSSVEDADIDIDKYIDNSGNFIKPTVPASPAGVPSGSTLIESGNFVGMYQTPAGTIVNNNGDLISRGTMDTVFSTATPFAVGQIWQGLAWSLAVAGAIKTLGPIFGMKEDETNAVAIGAMAGIMAGKLAYSFLGRGGTTWGSSWLASENGAIGSKSLFGFGGQGQTARFISSPGFSVGLGLAAAWLTYNAMWKKDKVTTETVSFSCLPWQAPNGGADCELCNDKTGIPCSEYRCKSLGQSCSIINAGTASERCVNTNPRDVSPPVIKPNENDITTGYIYTDVKDMPPGAGFKIAKDDMGSPCIKPFTPITFGIITDEPSQCKIDIVPKGNYSQMSTYFGGDNLYAYNHTEFLSLPSVTDIKNSSLNLENGKELSFFIRCKDANGNSNEADYELKLCVDKSPDTTAPEIQGTNIINGGCIKSDADNATVDFYINEPADCKWSFTANQDYKQMENNMVCSNSIRDINALQVYTCSALLTGVARDKTNFYVKCQDQPALGNSTNRTANIDDYVFSLRGSEKLKLKNVQPNETIYGAVRPTAVELYAETMFGCDNSQAICYYSTTGVDSSFVQFFDTNKADGIHTQRLDLNDGPQTYFVRCIDSGGNLAETSVNFNVEIDTNAPVIARAYEEDNYLKLLTTRNSECVYTNDNCDFSFPEGTVMPYANSTAHVVEWNQDKTYYIKCRDEFRTETADCSMIIKPTANFLGD